MPDLTDDDFLQMFGPYDVDMRAVYADWLDERGDPRAEYVRLVVQAAEVAAKLTELRKSFDPEWVRAVQLAPYPPSICFGDRHADLRSLRQRQLRHSSVREYREAVEYWLEIYGQEAERGGLRPPLFLPPTGWPDALPPRPPEVLYNGDFEVWTESDGTAHLQVVWLQDDLAMPFAPEALDRMAAADWQRHATPGGE